MIPYIPCMEPYDSMRFHAWKRHAIIVLNHMVPCMKSHGRLMNSDHFHPLIYMDQYIKTVFFCLTILPRQIRPGQKERLGNTFYEMPF